MTGSQIPTAHSHPAAPQGLQRDLCWTEMLHAALGGSLSADCALDAYLNWLERNK
jgi:hypothetical protein